MSHNFTQAQVDRFLGILKYHGRSDRRDINLVLNWSWKRYHSLERRLTDLGNIKRDRVSHLWVHANDRSCPMAEQVNSLKYEE